MSNKELYKNTFSQFHASQNKITEVIKMTKKSKENYGRRLIAVALCAIGVASAGVVANAATDGELVKEFMCFFTNSDGATTSVEGNVSYDEDGNKITEAELEDGTSIKKTENSDGDTEIEITESGDGDTEITYNVTFDEEGSKVGDIVISKEDVDEDELDEILDSINEEAAATATEE